MSGYSGCAPVAVSEILEFCEIGEMSVIISRNKPAGNCRDAKSKRNRLGHEGIPLFDELKSSVEYYYDGNGEKVIVAIHCRGDEKIDRSLIEAYIGKKERVPVELSRLEGEELHSELGMEFGTVNPILLEIRSKGGIHQFFDESLLDPPAPCPGTMMTNAGEHTWAMEFNPIQLLGAINRKSVFRFAQGLREVKHPKTIGIITGNGPASGIALWEGINRNFAETLGRDFSGDVSLPQVHVMSLPELGLSMELDKRENAVWAALEDAVLKMKDLGVEVLCLACHTTHYFTEQIRELFETDGQVFFSMAETVMEHIYENNIDDVAVLGINHVADFGEMSSYKELSELNVETLSFETMEKIRELGYRIKGMKDMYPAFQSFINILKSDIKSKNIVIAMTELSLLFQKQANKNRTSERNIIDPLELYAKKICEKAFEESRTGGEKNENGVTFKKYDVLRAFDPCKQEKPLSGKPVRRGAGTGRQCAFGAQVCGNMQQTNGRNQGLGGNRLCQRVAGAEGAGTDI